MPQKNGLLTHEERNHLAAYPSFLFTDAERAEFKSKLDKITETFGYRCNERSSHATALRMYILGTTDHTPEDLADMSTMPHDELVRHMRGFIEMMDSEKRPATECAKDLVRMHKNAMRKIMNYRIPEYRLDNIEDIGKQQKLAELFRSMYIDYSQDMQNLRAGSSSGKDLSEIRRAYNEVYDPIQADREESKLDAYVSSYATTISNLSTEYEKGNKYAAAGSLDDLRIYATNFSGKTISEMPLHIVGSHRYGVNALITMPKMQDRDADFDRYLNGETGTFPGQNEARETIRLYETNAVTIHNETPDKASRLLNKNLMEPAVSLIPDNAPDKLTDLPDETKAAIEECYHRTFEELYRAGSMNAISDAGLSPFDLIKAGDRSINEIVGNKYAALSPEEQTFAKKLEVIRILKENPDGLNVHYVEYVPSENGYTTRVSAQGVNIRPRVDSVNFKFQLSESNPLTSEIATSYLANPKPPVHESITAAEKTVRETFKQILPTANVLLKKHNLDIYDCIYIGDETVNEIYAKRYAQGRADFTKDSANEIKNQIIVLESFHVAKEIFIALPTEGANGRLQSKVLPVTFSGTGIEFVPGQKRTNTIASVKAKGEEILKKREAFYKEREAAEKQLLETAKEAIISSADNAFRKSMDRRMKHIEINAGLTSPINNVLLSKVKEKIDGLYDRIVTASNEYETYRLAAATCNDEVLKAKFEERAEEIRNTSPLSDYENYVQGLEYAYGVRQSDGMIPDGGKLDSYFHEKFGFCVPLIVTSEYGITDYFYRPVEITLDMKGDSYETSENAKNLVHAVYNLANLKVKINDQRTSAETLSFGKRILIDGVPAQSLYHPKDNEDLTKPEFMAKYEETMGNLVVSALKRGKNVDFYIAAGGESQTQISSVPITIKSNVPAKIGANEKAANEAKQFAGHVKLINDYPTIDDVSLEDIKKSVDRQEKNKETQFDKSVRRYTSVFNAGEYALTAGAFRSKYFPQGNPAVAKQPNPQEGAPTGEIRPDRNLSVNYVFARLAADSLKLKSENKAGYTIEDITNPEKLKEQKKQYADEFIAICESYDTVAYNRNMITGAKAALDLFNESVSVLDMAGSVQNLRNAMTGNTGYMVYAFCDYMQELNLERNRKVQKHYNIISDEEMDRLSNTFTDLTSLKNLSDLAEQDEYLILVQTKAPEAKQFSNILAVEWARQSILENEKLGLSPFRSVMDASKIGAETFDALFQTDVMRQFLADKNRAATIIGNGEFFNHVFVDIDAYYDAMVSKQPFNANDFVFRLDPAHPERRAELENAAIERRMNKAEKEAFDLRFQNQLSNCKLLYEKEPEAGMLQRSTLLKAVEEMTPDEITRAARLYDTVFGPLMNRTAVREYLAANPGKTEFDLLHVGNMSMAEYLHKPFFRPGVPPAPEGINIYKAEAMRLAFDGSIPLSYDVVRKNVAGRIAITGRESIINPEITSRVLEERPYLKDVNSFMAYARKKHLLQEGVEYSNADIKGFIDERIREGAREIFANDRFTSLGELKKANSLNEQDFSFAKMQSVFGAKPVYIKDWADTSADVYNKDQFVANLPDYATGNFSDRKFAVLAMLASMNPEFVMVNEELIAENYEGDGINRAFKRDMPNWTSAFMQNSPASMGDYILKNIVSPARQAANDAIRAMQGENPDTLKMESILFTGLKRELELARSEGSILDPAGTFGFHAEIIKEINAILDTNPQLKAAVENSLSDNEKNDFKSILRIKELSDHRTEAQNALEKAAKGEIHLSDEEKSEYFKQISDFNYVAEAWSTNYNTVTTSAEYMAVAAAAEAKKAAVHDMNSIAAIEQEKEEYLEQKLHVAEPIQNILLTEGQFEQYKANQNEQINKLNEFRTFLREQITQYKTAEAIPVKDEQNHYNVQPQVLSDRKHRMLEASYRLNKADNLISERITDAMAAEIGRRYNLAHPDRKQNITNKRVLMDTLKPEYRTEEEYTALVDEIIAELSMQSYLTGNLKEEIDAITLPTDLLANNFEACITHPKENEINALKTTLQNEKNNLQQHPAAGSAERIQAINQNLEILDDVYQNLTQTKNEIKTYLENYHDLESLSTLASENAFHSYKEYQNGAYEDLIIKTNAYLGQEEPKDIKINPEKAAQVRQLREHPTIASEDTRRGIMEILNKMNEFGMIPADREIPFEQGQNKTYVYDKYAVARTALMNAVDSGNMQDIARYRQELNTEREHLRELFNMVKEKFPNVLTTPGNISSMRTASIPLEFSKDSKEESLLNGIFLLGCQIKRSGLGTEEFLKNPIEGTFKVNRKEIEKRSFTNQVESFNTVADAINMMYIKSNGGRSEEDFTPQQREHLREIGYEFGSGYDQMDFQREVFNGPYGAIGHVRPLEVIFSLEGDQEVKDNLYREFMLMNSILEVKTQAEARYFAFFEDDVTSPVGKECRDRFVKGIKAALVEGDKLTRRHMLAVAVDDNGIPKKDPLDYEYTLKIADRYQHLIQTFNANLKPALCMVGGRDMMKRAMEESLFDYLKAHPEDMTRREYKNLESLALSAGKKLGTQTSQAADYLQFKENYNQKVIDLTNGLAKQEEAFKKEVTLLQKELNRAGEDLVRARNRHENTDKLQKRILEIEENIRDAADNRMLELTLDYKRQKMTQTYLKERCAQLNALKNNPRSLDYQRNPRLISDVPEEKIKDCRLIANIVNKKIWPDVIKDIPKHLMDVKSYQHYRLREEENRIITYTDELTKEEWKNAYQNDLLTYLDEHVPLPEGIRTRNEILEDMEKRHEAMSRRMLDEKLLGTMLNNQVPGAEFVVLGEVGPSFADKMGGFEQKINSSFASYLKEPNVPDPNDVFPGDSYKQILYDDIAEIMATGIAENKGGEVPGGINGLKTRIAGDVEFKRILLPILEKVEEEANPAIDEAAQRHDWRELLSNMLRDRTIVNAYSAQKSNPDMNTGFELIRQAVISNQPEINKRIQAANQAAANQAANPQAGPVLH